MILCLHILPLNVYPTSTRFRKTQRSLTRSKTRTSLIPKIPILACPKLSISICLNSKLNSVGTWRMVSNTTTSIADTITQSRTTDVCLITRRCFLSILNTFTPTIFATSMKVRTAKMRRNANYPTTESRASTTLRSTRLNTVPSFLSTWTSVNIRTTARLLTATRSLR
jgi:hypothetical protein